MTAEQLAEDPRYENCELWDGLPVVKEPSGGYASYAAAELLSRLGGHVRSRSLGWIGGADVGYWLQRRPDRVLSPDAAFVSFARMPVPPTRGFAELIPDFVVEVASPTQSWREVLTKGFLWTSHGVPVVWLVDPIDRRILVLRPNASPFEAGPGGVADAAPSLPEFQVAVDDLFRPFGPPPSS